MPRAVPSNAPSKFHKDLPSVAPSDKPTSNPSENPVAGVGVVDAIKRAMDFMALKTREVVRQSKYSYDCNKSTFFIEQR